MELSQARIDRRTHRLIASRYPTIGVFDRVARPEDLEAVIQLEGWSNDRLNSELGRLHHLPRDEWLVGTPGATIVMAAFCHTSASGGRFSDNRLGCWYAGFSLRTAIAETVYHHGRRLAASAMGWHARIQMREIVARLSARFHDLRGLRRRRRALYHPEDYSRSQAFATELRAAGANGVLWDSLRDPGGTAVAVFRPKLVRDPTQGDHFEYRWTGDPAPEIVRLTGPGGVAAPGS